MLQYAKFTYCWVRNYNIDVMLLVGCCLLATHSKPGLGSNALFVNLFTNYFSSVATLCNNVILSLVTVARTQLHFARNIQQRIYYDNFLNNDKGNELFLKVSHDELLLSPSNRQRKAVMIYFQKAAPQTLFQTRFSVRPKR